MLINRSKSYEADEVVTLRLTTGEEVMARFVEETDLTFKVSRPMVLMAGPQGAMLTQMAMTLELNTEVEFQKSHVVIHGRTREEAADSYIQATTGIKPVRGSLLNASGMQAR